MNKGKIYKLECPDGYFYIGYTIQSLKDRLLSHKYNLKKNYNSKLYKHLKTIDWKTVTIKLIEEIEYKTINELLLKETEYIEKVISNELCLNTAISYNKNKKRKETKSKIYKLICNDSYFYIGSTISTLSTRLKNHKKDSKDSNSKLYNHIKKIGWDNVKISLLEEFITINKQELLEKEYDYIRKENSEFCLNTYIYDNENDRIKNRKEYIKKYEETNKDKICKRKKEYNNKNKEKICIRVKEYVQNNKEKIQEKRKIYYENNKEKINLMNRINYDKNKRLLN